MRIFEAILGIVFLIGIFMGIKEIDGAAAVVTFSAFPLIFMYFFLGFLFFKEGAASKGVVLSTIALGILYALGVAGLQFKWMLYPGSGSTMRAGFLGLALTPVLIFGVHKGNKSVNNLRNWVRFAVVAACYLISFMVYTDQIIEWKTEGRPLETEALKKAIKDQNEESWEAYEEIRMQYIEERQAND